MSSCLYRGWVQHTRFVPHRHVFRYQTYFACLDLTNLEQALPSSWLWSIERPAPLSFRRRDHIGDPGTSLPETIRALLVQDQRPGADGKILLLTQFRHFGYVFNPLSLYFCFDLAERWVATVAEVRNTPWGETFCYVLDGADRPGHVPDPANHLDCRTAKQFHVSPFMGMNMQYAWQISRPGNTLTIKIENVENDKRLFQAVLELRREPITRTNLLRSACRFPLSSHRTILAIYWQALRLWWKRCPYFPHPKNLEPQQPV